jgi:hypothetical protein
LGTARGRDRFLSILEQTRQGSEMMEKAEKKLRCNRLARPLPSQLFEEFVLLHGRSLP